MSDRIELSVGAAVWPLSVPAEKLARPWGGAAPAGDATELARAAVRAPLGLGAPLRAALTPDDRVAIVVDPTLPGVGGMVGAVMEELEAAGVAADAIAAIVPPHSSDAWLADLPDEQADLQLVVHDPAAADQIAYLATTRAGRRLYLNRTLVEADAVVVLAPSSADPHAVLRRLYPGLTNVETVRALASLPVKKGEVAGDAEAVEVAWLLGSPVFVQVVPGDGGAPAEVVASLLPKLDAAAERHRARWNVAVSEPPDLVIATVGGAAETVTFADLAKAVRVAGKASGGRVALLTAGAPAVPPSAEEASHAADADEALARIKKSPDPEADAVRQWLRGARGRDLFVASGWNDDQAEELFAAPLASPAELQRLADRAERVLVLPDAHRVRLETP